MLYNITRPIAKITLGVYFRKIYISNREVLPKNKPILLAANHPTAFIEPCILACWLDKPLSFIARGDLYANNFILRKLYDWYRMTPVFRLEDTGYGNLRNNYESFDRCFDTLKQNKTLMILAEGRVKHEKRLRPIMKGTARIVFGALEKYGDLDIHVVPVGVNYSNPDKFRSLAMIDFGEPIRATEYTALYRENPARAMNKLTRDLGKKLKERVIHIDREADEELVEQLFELKENDLKVALIPPQSTKADLLFAEKKIASYVNGLKEERKASLSEKTRNYFNTLKAHKISDFGLMNRHYFNRTNTLLVVLGWLPQMIGKVINAPPLLLGTYIAGKIAPAVEFRASTAIVFSAALYLFYFPAIGLVLFLNEWSWWTLLVVLLPILGYFHLIYKELHKKWQAGGKVQKLDGTMIETLLKARNSITKQVKGF